MPNHVDHDMIVSGDEKDMMAFADVAREGKEALSAHKFIPYPAQFKSADDAREEAKKSGVPYKNLPKDGFNSGGYDWCCEHWGTKWGIYSAKLSDDREQGEDEPLIYTFQSAWSPPWPVIAAMSKRFTRLFFDVHAYERGMQFQIHRQYLAGNIVTTHEAKYFGNRGG